MMTCGTSLSSRNNIVFNFIIDRNDVIFDNVPKCNKSLPKEYPMEIKCYESIYCGFFIADPVGSPNLSTTPYRTVSYRFPLQFLSRSRSLSARRTVFSA
jgi:hypothetical protein